MSTKNTTKLTKEEQAVDRAVTRGDYTTTKHLDSEKKYYAKVAKQTFAKMKTVNFRISERNLLRLKAAAAREGVSYQTYVTALIQKNV